jgi:hypothetical protein
MPSNINKGVILVKGFLGTLEPGSGRPSGLTGAPAGEA